MNKYLKYALTCIGVLCFIELQVITFCSVKNTITSNNNFQPPMEMNSTNMNNDRRGNGMSAPGENMGDISDSAITPNNKSNKTNTSETNA